MPPGSCQPSARHLHRHTPVRQLCHHTSGRREACPPARRPRHAPTDISGGARPAHLIRPVAPVGGGPPARSPHTSFARSDRSRSPARPRRRPQAPQPGPTGLTPPSHRCKQPSARTHHRPQAPQPGPINVARNSLATTSNFEVTLLELQRFQRLLKLHPIELRAKFWKTVPQLIQQVARWCSQCSPRRHSRYC